MYGGSLYSSNRGGSTLSRIDIATRQRTGLWRVPGCASLYGIAVDRYGHVWLGNYSCKDVLRFDPRTETWARFSVGRGNSRGMAANAAGEVFVAVDTTNKVYKFDGATGETLGIYDVGQSGVIGIALDDEDFVWTVARNSQRASKMAPMASSSVITTSRRALHLLGYDRTSAAHLRCARRHLSPSLPEWV